MTDQDQTEDSSPTLAASDALAVIDGVAPSGWRMKLAKAVAQILIGTRAGAAVYAEAREHLDEIEGRSAMNKQLYAIASKQVLDDPEMVERAKARLVGSSLRKQENLEAVLHGAAGEMPTRLQIPDFRNETVSADNQEASLPDDDALDADWVATFTDVAEGATSDELRSRLSKMLLGETIERGTIPRSIIRAVAEVEQSDLQLLVSVMPFIIGELVVRDESISTDTLAQLNEAGLVEYNSTFGITQIWNASPARPGALSGYKWAVIMNVSMDKSIELSVVRLTRAGKAIISFLDGYDEKKNLTNFVEKIDKENIQRIIIGRYDKVNSGQISISSGSIIYPAPVYVNIKTV